jgi:hypothetical protein
VEAALLVVAGAAGTETGVAATAEAPKVAREGSQIEAPAPTWTADEVRPPTTHTSLRTVRGGRGGRSRNPAQQNAITTAVERVLSTGPLEDEETMVRSQPDPPDPHMHPSSADEVTCSEMQDSATSGSDNDSGAEELGLLHDHQEINNA